MDKKTLNIIKIVLFVVGVVIGALVVFFVIKGNKPTTLDLATISENITNAGFSKMATMNIDKDVLSTSFDVNTENVEEVYGKMPMMNVHASMYILIKAKAGTVETVKQDIEAYGERYEQQWAMYLPNQHELVQNRKIGVMGDYVYMVIAENADELVSLIK